MKEYNVEEDLEEISKIKQESVNVKEDLQEISKIKQEQI